MNINKCPSNKIWNPRTSRCVLKTGLIGKILLNKDNIKDNKDYLKIRNKIEKEIEKFYNNKKILDYFIIKYTDNNAYFKNIGNTLKLLKYSVYVIKNTNTECIISLLGLKYKITYIKNDSYIVNLLSSRKEETIPRFRPDRYSVEEIAIMINEQLDLYNSKGKIYKKFIIVGNTKSVEFEEFKFKDIGEILQDNGLDFIKIIKNTNDECIFKLENLVYKITYKIELKKVLYLITLLKK